MEILQHHGRPEARRAFVIRSKPWVNLGAALGATGLAAGALWALVFRVEVNAGWQLLLLSPFVVIGGLLLLLIVTTCWGAFRASLQATNWSWVVREREVWINLRDYRNANAGEAVPVLRLASEDLERAVVVVESYRIQTNQSTEFRRRKSIDLYVHGLDAKALEAALNAERKHPGRVARRGNGKTKFRSQPVTLLGDEGIRVPYSKRLQFCLEHVVAFESDVVRIDLDDEWKDLKPLERAIELHRRGHEFAARKVLERGEDLSRKAADELLQSALEARARDAA